MSNWDAEHYLKYNNERSRAASDLTERIDLDKPKSIADLGCGPGNSTHLLRERWPHANIIGVDNSANMLNFAKQVFPAENWQLADLADWHPEISFDLIYSNAALQWLPEHNTLMRRLFEFVSENGALAFQIPSNTYSKVRTLIHEISHDPIWTECMVVPRNVLTMEAPTYYYDILADLAGRLDIWETEYIHIMDSKESIVDWVASTGLRPFLAVLDSEVERNAFLDRLRQGVDDAYKSRVDGKFLYPFRRTFVIAYR